MTLVMKNMTLMTITLNMWKTDMRTIGMMRMRKSRSNVIS